MTGKGRLSQCGKGMGHVNRGISTELRPSDRQPLPPTGRRGGDVASRARGDRSRPGYKGSPRISEGTRAAVRPSDPTKLALAQHACGSHARLGGDSPVLDEAWDSLLECTSDLVVVVDGRGRISHVNHVSASIPHGQESVAGRSIYDFLSPECRAKVRESIQDVLRTGEMVRQMVCFSANGSGTRRSEACIGPVTRDGRIVAVGIFFTDITERTRLQAQLNERERMLKSIVRAVPRMMDIVEGLLRDEAEVVEPKRRARELELCREHMIQIGRLASIGKASSGLTQRLPQFLTAISMSIENALARLGPGTSHDGAGPELEAALRAVSAMTLSVEQVRGFAETGPRQLLIHAVDLGASLARVAQLLETRARGANTVIHIKDGEEWPRVRMAEGDADQLFFVLIDNLMRFADTRRDHRITVSSAVNGPNVELKLSGDNGLASEGNSDVPSNRPLLFEPATQSVDLGLYVAWDIVVRAGGSIRCESTGGPGTAFLVCLPIIDRASCGWDHSGRKRKTTRFRR